MPIFWSEWKPGPLLWAVSLVAFSLGCVAPPPQGTRAPELRLSVRGPDSGSQHKFGTRLELAASVRGGAPPYQVTWTNSEGKTMTRYAVALRLDHPSGKNEYVVKVVDQGGRTVSERLVFLTPVESLPAAASTPLPPARSEEDEWMAEFLETDSETGVRVDPLNLLNPLPSDREHELETAPADDTQLPEREVVDVVPRLDPPDSSSEEEEAHTGSQADSGLEEPDGELPEVQVETVWEINSIIYNAQLHTPDHQTGNLLPPLQEGSFSGSLSGDEWTGTIEDAWSGKFEFETKRQGADRFKGTIRPEGGDWVPLEITSRLVELER